MFIKQSSYDDTITNGANCPKYRASINILVNNFAHTITYKRITYKLTLW